MVDLHGPLTSIVDELLKLSLIKLNDALLRHREVCLEFEFVLVLVSEVDLLKIKPILNSSKLVIGQGSYDLIDRWEVHLV